MSESVIIDDMPSTSFDLTWNIFFSQLSRGYTVYQLGMITDRRSWSLSVFIDTDSGQCRWVNNFFFTT